MSLTLAAHAVYIITSINGVGLYCSSNLLSLLLLNKAYCYLLTLSIDSPRAQTLIHVNLE